jgi:hypothetical protein
LLSSDFFRGAVGSSSSVRHTLIFTVVKQKSSFVSHAKSCVGTGNRSSVFLMIFDISQLRPDKPLG